jgi:hypothetical protein
MATAKRARVKAEPKTLKLVCKCGACTHWEILLTRNGTSRRSGESIKCMTCKTTIPVYFSVEPHEGLHYERQGRNES